MSIIAIREVHMTDSNKRWKQICTILFLIVCLQCLGSFHTIHAAKTVTMVVGETKQLKKALQNGVPGSAQSHRSAERGW